ncbi:hypothetical protein [Ornithinimicrobium kibberense]
MLRTDSPSATAAGRSLWKRVIPPRRTLLATRPEAHHSRTVKRA